VVEVRPSVGKIVQATFVEKYHTSVIKGMVFGFENRNSEFFKYFGRKKLARTDDLTPFYGTGTKVMRKI